MRVPIAASRSTAVMGAVAHPLGSKAHGKLRGAAS